MTNKTVLGRSFSRHEQKRLGCRAFLSCFVIAFTLCTVLKSCVGPPPFVILEQSTDSGLKMLMSTEEISKPRQSYIDADEISPNPILGNFSNSRSQVYEMSGDIRIHGNSSTIFIASTQAHECTTSWTVKPYARKAISGNGEANKRSWWTTKYKVLLQKLSKFDVIDIDNENQVLCVFQE
ncbi:hypothetical protein Sango_0156700 [Sesamum angolense]|uniref:Uncharacterized protein n=1 Tax=Sesamum angolense TaxID=2727404 RepID=A0AAE2C6F2_9LAMI|nr:hypothetical protein Sango_0156700 [Sesamum angolense]